MSSSNDTTNQKVVLTGSTNCHRWKSLFISKAKTLRLWEYIDPDNKEPPTFLKEPMMPTFSFESESTGVQTRSSEPTDTFTETDKARLQIYKIRNDHYNLQSRNIATLKSWVEDTVETRLREHCCKHDADLRVWYSNLAEAAGLDIHLARGTAMTAWGDFFYAIYPSNERGNI